MAAPLVCCDGCPDWDMVSASLVSMNCRVKRAIDLCACLLYVDYVQCYS